MMLLHVYFMFILFQDAMEEKKIVVDIASGLFVSLIMEAQVEPIGLWDTVSFRCVLRSLKNAVGHLGIPYLRKIHKLHIVYRLHTAFYK